MSNGLPNVVYILADDMGYGDLSCLNGDSRIRTANLDRLAAEGLACGDAHSSSAVCTPSRYTILTGRYNWRSVLKEGVTGGYSRPILEPGRMTVASMLREQGYATGCIGKWHLGLEWRLQGGGLASTYQDESQVDFAAGVGNGPLDHGFDSFFGISASLDMPPYVYIENDRVTALPDRVTPQREGKEYMRPGMIAPDFVPEQVLQTLTARAERFIDDHAAEPFFLYLPLPAPHTPIFPDAAFQGTSGTNAYGDFCLQVDDTVGRVMAALERNGVAENTILIFTADNGCSPMADFEELAAVGHHPSHLFRGHKADIYEGGHRIPYVMRWPAGIEAGRWSDATFCLADLMATMAEICGVALPDDAAEDSVSCLAIWNGTASGPVREATVHHSINGSFAIRRGRWKLELCPGSGGWSDPRPQVAAEEAAAGTRPWVQLYDMEQDVGERSNVCGAHPEVVSELTALLTRYVRDGRSTPGAPQPNSGPNHWPQLHWLNDAPR